MTPSRRGVVICFLCLTLPQHVQATTNVDGVSVITDDVHRSDRVAEDPVALACTGTDVKLISEARTMEGAEVRVKGVVTGVFETRRVKGYYLQEIVGDGDDSTSDAIFVYKPSASVAQGDLVEVRGTVSSYFGNIQISPQTEEVCGAAALPSPVSLQQLPTRGEVADGFWSAYYGMLIEVAVPAKISNVYGLTRWGELGLYTGAQPVTASQVYDPSTAQHDALLATYRDTLTLSDGGNKDPLPFPGNGFSARNFLRAHDVMVNVTGPLTYRYSKTIIDKTPGLSQPLHVARNTRPAVPPSVGGRVQVASMNVQNYFNGPPGGLPFSDDKNRGADSEGEFEKQREKIIRAMSTLNPTIIALAEIENNGNGPGSAVQDIVDGLNEAAGSEVFAAPLDFEKVGTDVIAVNFVYQPAVVKVVGTPAILDSSVDPEFIDTRNRPSIAVTFEELASGNQFTVVATHLKSKGCSCPEESDVADPPGAGCCNGIRTKASRAMGRWMQTYPTGIATDDVLITGDMNALHAETPIQALIQDFGYVDMVDKFLTKEAAYTYTFDGLNSYLDHALASPSLAAKIRAVDSWHVNADESYAIHYSDCMRWRPTVYRHSDHDPLLIGLFGGDDPSPQASPQASLGWWPFLLGGCLVLVSTLVCVLHDRSTREQVSKDPEEAIETS